MSFYWRRVFLALILPAAFALPAVAQAPSLSAATMPDFSGMWVHPYFPGVEPPPSGPGPVFNRLHRTSRGGDNTRFVGDYSNPILKPGAAAIVKSHGDISLSGMTYPTPSNRCWPSGVPYIFFQPGMQMVQRGREMVFLYLRNHEFRLVRMNDKHPANVVPSWYGDLVAHYEGDTLVIDTVGVKADRPIAMVDMYGTPFTAALHVVERYRMVDYDEAQAGGAQYEGKRPRPRHGFRPHLQGKRLQVVFTVEDEGVFTMPWSGAITYEHPGMAWEEIVCAENPFEFFAGKNDALIPTAARADF